MNNSMKEKLKEIFDNTNNWLNFAEAKNGALIAINSTLIIEIFSNLFDQKINVNSCLGISILFSLGLLLISNGIALWSFKPMTDKFVNTGSNDYNDLILMFYGDIAKCKNATQYVLSLYKNYFNDYTKNEKDINKQEIDYAREIIYNSKITVRKYKFFRWALNLTILAFVSLTLGILKFSVIKIFRWFDQ